MNDPYAVDRLIALSSMNHRDSPSDCGTALSRIDVGNLCRRIVCCGYCSKTPHQIEHFSITATPTTAVKQQE